MKEENKEQYGNFSMKKIIKFHGSNIRELEDFPFSEVGMFKIIPNESNKLQLRIDNKQVLVNGEYLLRDDINKYKILIEKNPIVELLEEYKNCDFPKDFLHKLIEII